MVMAQSLFITLKQQHPLCQIDVLAPAWSLPLLERMPEVRHAIAMPLGHGQLGLSARYQLGKQLKSHAYDQAILLPNSWKSALVPFFASIPLRTGFLVVYQVDSEQTNQIGRVPKAWQSLAELLASAVIRARTKPVLKHQFGKADVAV